MNKWTIDNLVSNLCKMLPKHGQKYGRKGEKWVRNIFVKVNLWYFGNGKIMSCKQLICTPLSILDCLSLYGDTLQHMYDVKRGLEFFSPTSNWYDIWELTRAQRVQFSQYNSLISRPLAQWTTSKPGRPSASWHLFGHRFHRLRACHFRRGWFSGWRFHFSSDTQSL